MNRGSILTSYEAIKSPLDLYKEGYRSSLKYLTQDEIITISLTWKKEWTRIFIISDFHIGDNFGHDSDKFLNWIDRFGADLIILNGDIFDLWRDDLQNIGKSHSHLFSAFDSPKYLFLRGNHDCLEGITDHLELQLKEKKILISHGFQNDPGIMSKFNQAFTWYTEKVVRKIPILKSFVEVIIHLWSSNSIKKYTRDFARSAIDKFKYDIVIHGHVHEKPNIAKYKGSLIVNDGHCEKGAFNGVLLTNEGNIILIDH